MATEKEALKIRKKRMKNLAYRKQVLDELIGCGEQQKPVSGMHQQSLANRDENIEWSWAVN